MDRLELANVLKAARARTAPEEVGLTVGPRRRGVGLRREEVAQLAGPSERQRNVIWQWFLGVSPSGLWQRHAGCPRTR